MADGRIYEGEWKDNIRQGIGVFRWTGGDIYIGQFVNDRKEGLGK